ncbi:TPA: MobH family relaxase [Vibrio parahaemolyticus]
MLSRFRGVVYKMLAGAADKVAPATSNSIEIPAPELSIEDLIRYPPETKGIPVIPLEKILASQSEILRLMHRDSGMPDPEKEKGKSKDDQAKKEYQLNFDTLFRQVVTNYIRYVHLLPASENHHHSDVGGLARHSLEVALNSLRRSQQQVLPAIGHLDEEQARKPRWQYAAWICGLLHDAGKILYDMRVYDVDTGEDWNPYLSDLISWAHENKVSRYRVTWKPEHRHKKHENLSVQVLEWILTPEAKFYLMDNSDELPIAINHALAHYGGHDGYLQTCIREADSASTEKDIRTQWHEMIGKRRYPLESAIVKAMRRLRDSWEVNKPKGHIWVIGEEVYLAWPKSIQLIVQQLQEDKVDVPVNPTRILEILEERNLVNRMDDSVTYSMFTPEMDGVTGAERVIQLAWPGLLYETMPVPRSVPGLLRLNNDGKSLEYRKDGSVIEIEPEEERADKASNSTGSQSSREATQQRKNLKNAAKSVSEVKEDTDDSSTQNKTVDSKTKKPRKKSVPKKPDNKKGSGAENTPPTPKSDGNKGLVFANQGEPNQQTNPNEQKQVEQVQDKPQVKDSVSASDSGMDVPAYLMADEYDDSSYTEGGDELKVPAYLLGEQDDATVQPRPNQNPNQKKGNPTGDKAPVKPVKQKSSQQKSSTKASESAKGVVPMGTLLKRKEAFGKAKPQISQTKGWLGQKKHGRSQADLFLIDLANAMANGDLSVEAGEGIFLTNGQLHIDTQMLTKVLDVEAGPISSILKNERLLDYDKLKPNLLVQRKTFGRHKVMVFSLIKSASQQLCSELGITVNNIDYNAEEQGNPTRETSPKHEIEKTIASSDKPESGELAKKIERTGGENAGGDDEITLLMKYLNTKSENGCEFMQKTKDGRHWGIYAQGAIKSFIQDVRPGASRNTLSKELTLMADGVTDLETDSGRKKHLLIRKELIG